MEEKRTRSVVLGDTRGEGRFLRLTWHPSTRTVVFSHWNGAVCTASTPVKLADATKVIDLLVAALTELANAETEASPSARQPLSFGQRLLRRLRPARAAVIGLVSRPSKSDQSSRVGA